MALLPFRRLGSLPELLVLGAHRVVEGVGRLAGEGELPDELQDVGKVLQTVGRAQARCQLEFDELRQGQQRNAPAADGGLRLKNLWAFSTPAQKASSRSTGRTSTMAS